MSTATEPAIPRTLPITNFSVSSMTLLSQCPTKWYRRYVLAEYEPTSGPALLGKSIHAAESLADRATIDYGERLPVGDVLDEFTDDFDERSENEEVEWRDDKPGTLKDSGVAVIRVYEQTIGPKIEPAETEREILLDLPDVDYGFRGFIDLEEKDGAVVDRKITGKRIYQQQADAALQATAYLLARRTEGNPAPEFRFHSLLRTSKPAAEVVRTTRTDRQMDSFIDRIYKAGAEVLFRLENDCWGYADPNWWGCSAKWCGYWDGCLGGGLR